MSREGLKSLIVTDPDLVDPELDVSGLRTQTDTDPRLLASIADFPGISYDPTQFSYLTDLNELFAYGLPVVDTPTASNINIPLPGGGGSGGGGNVSATITAPSANTPEEQRLIDAGIGVQGAPGDPVVAPGEIPVTQQQLDDFNQIPVTPVNEFTTGDASLAEQIAAEDRAAQLANVQDPTTMLPQTGSISPTVFDGTATLEDAGAGEGGMQLAEVGLGAEADFTPSSTYDEAGLQIAEAPFGINPATGEPYQTPRTIADQNRVLGVVTEEDLVDNRNLLQKLGLPADFDIKQAALEAGINLAVGVPITLIARGLGIGLDALGNIIPSGISTTTNKAREAGLLVGDSTVTQDKYGINTQSQFGDYNQYNVDQVEKLENRLEELRTDKYKDDFQAYLDNTKRMRTELEERKNYLKISGADGDIDERDQMLEDIVLQNKIDAGIQAADDDKGDDMLDTTGVTQPFDRDTFDDDVTLTSTPPTGTITPLEDDFEFTTTLPPDRTTGPINLSDMSREEMMEFANELPGTEGLDLIQAYNDLQEYESDLEEIGKDADYIGYTEQEKADIAAGKKTPELGELIDFALDETVGKPADTPIDTTVTGTLGPPSEISGPQVTEEKPVDIELADNRAVRELNSSQIIEYENLTNQLEGQEIQKTGNPDISISKQEEIKNKAIDQIKEDAEFSDEAFMVGDTSTAAPTTGGSGVDSFFDSVDTITGGGGGRDRDPDPAPSFDPGQGFVDQGGGGEFGGAPSAPSQPDYSNVTTASAPPGRGGGSGGSPSQGGGSPGAGSGCVIATHAVNSGAFTKDTKREAVRWCVKNLHRTWWGEAIRRGYRYYGQKAIEEGKAKNHYQEFKDYVAFGTGKRRTLKTGWTFVYRSVQFFIRGLING
jgi:hypothetical protein